MDRRDYSHDADAGKLAGGLDEIEARLMREAPPGAHLVDADGRATHRAQQRLDGLKADLARRAPPDVFLIRATLDEPAPVAVTPGAELRIALLSALASHSILDAYGRASPGELDELHARLRANAPAVRRLTRRSLAAFLAWAEAALRPYLDDAGEAPR